MHLIFQKPIVSDGWLLLFHERLRIFHLRFLPPAGALSLYCLEGLSVKVGSLLPKLNGRSTAQLFASQRFLFGFLPGVVVIALLRGKSDTSSFAAAARTAGRYLLAALVGGVVVVYAFGFVIQSALTGAPLAAVALASMGFVVGDAIKAVVASLAAAGLSKLGR